MSDLNKIKEKIIKLRAMIPEKGASEAEALSALEKADALMAEHGITEEELNTSEAIRDMSHGEFAYGIKTQHPCAKWCSKPIGQFCGVITWYDSNRQASNGFGFNGDVEMYEFLLKMIHDTMNREWKEWLKVNPKRPGVSRHTEYWSFMWGISEAVIGKLHSLMKAREKKSTGTDLVALKHQVVAEGIKEVLPSLALKPTKSRGTRVEGSAVAAGMEAGNRINLNRPLQRGVGRKRIA